MKITDEELNKMSYEQLIDLTSRIGAIKKKKYRTSETYQTTRFHSYLKQALKHLEKNRANERYDAEVIDEIYDDIKYILKIKEETER